MNKLALLYLFLSFLLLISGFEIALKEKKDNEKILGWEFSKSRPFHYFHSVKDIGSSFLPVHLDKLPQSEWKGAWILRYKDLSGLPQTFSVDNSEDMSKSTIKYSPTHQLFNNISIKCLIMGDVTVDLVLGKQKKLVLFPDNRNTTCHHATVAAVTTESLKWVRYEVHTKLSSQMQLQVTIHHPNSFFMIDEISVAHSDAENSQANLLNEDSIDFTCAIDE